jgi:hypothetical protein
MILVVGMLAYFCLVGLTARHFGGRARWLLLAGIVTMVMLDVVTRAQP